VLRSYIPVLVFSGLGIVVGGLFAVVNRFVGPRGPRPGSPQHEIQQAAYESGIPVEVPRTFRFGISFYLIAMLFILFDIEVVFLYPVGVILNAADSVFVLAEVLIFVFLLMVALAYVWRKGALDWR
jgi:NADH-quinone oxidoreductase subunit A